MRKVLESGVIIRIRAGEYYKITGSIIGSRGGSLVYPCVRMIKRRENYEESNNLNYVIKECFPISTEYSFIRNDSGEIVPEKEDTGAKYYLETAKQMQLHEQEITRRIYQKGLPLIPIISKSEEVGISYDGGGTFQTVRNTMTVMESLNQKGRPLKTHLAENGGAVPVRTAFHVIEQVLLNVQEVHSAGFLHLDIQDGNLFIKGNLSEQNDIISLIDFETARECMEDGYTDVISDRVLFSTNGFTAPEMLECNDGTLRLGAEADIYSIGYILLTLLTGRYYDTNEIVAVLNGHYITSKKLRKMDCPKHMKKRMQEIIAKSLAHNPENRYHNCQEMLQDVSDFNSALNPYGSNLSAVSYDAFISYRHGDIDNKVAVALQKKLEHFGNRSIVKRNKLKKIQHVFLDEGELSCCSDFRLQIREALKNSGWLIVICSPGTKDSEWVNLEISTFLESHDRSRILVILTGGEPDEVFPDLLSGDSGKNMVLAADVRDISVSKILRKLNGDPLLKIVAPMLGTNFDSLKQRNRIYKFQRTAIASTMAGIILLAITLYTVYQSNRVQEQYHQTQISLARNLTVQANEQMKEGDRIGALETILSSAQNSFNRKKPLVPEQMYALNRALYTYQDSDLYIYNPLCMQKLDGLTTEVNDIGSENGFLLTLDYLGDAYIYDTEDGRLIWKTSAKNYCEEETKGFVWGKFIDDSQVILASENYYYIIDIQQKICKKIWETLYANDDNTEYAVSNNLFAVSHATSSAYLYDLTDESPSESVKTIGTLSGDEDIIIETESIKDITDIVFSEDASRLAICLGLSSLDYDSTSDMDLGYQTEIVIVDTADLQIIQSFSCDGHVNNAKFISNDFLGIFQYDQTQNTVAWLTSEEMTNYQSVFELSTGNKIWGSGENYYKLGDEKYEGIVDLGMVDISSGMEPVDCVCFYNQNLLTILDKNDWSIISSQTYEDKISGIGNVGDGMNFLVLLRNGTVDRYCSTLVVTSMSLEKDTNYSYYCQKTDTIIQFGDSYTSNYIIFSQQMHDDEVESIDIDDVDESSDTDYVFISQYNDTDEIGLKGKNYSCSYNEGNIRVQSLKTQKEVLNIMLQTTDDILFRFINNGQDFLVYDGRTSELTIWDIKSQKTIVHQYLNLESSFKTDCYVDEDSHYLLLEREIGHAVDVNDDGVLEQRYLDIFYWDDNMQFYQYASIPCGHYDPEAKKIYNDDGYCWDFYSYKTLLQRAQNTVDEFYEMNNQS